MKVLETKYGGCWFRSRLEARWAIFFDHLGVAWEYEAEGYDLDDLGCYLPDFWLPTITMRGGSVRVPPESVPREPVTGVILEIKPKNMTADDDAAAQSKLERLGAFLDVPTAIAYGPPTADLSQEGLHEVYPYWDAPMGFFRCETCGHVKIEYGEANYMYCPKCSRKYEFSTEQRAVAVACEAARTARFQNGIRPPMRKAI